MNNKINLGCSSIKLTSKNNNHYYFRTCDMNDEANIWKAGSVIVSYKKNHIFNFSNNNKIISKYSILGITYGNKFERLLDGINEKGLSGFLLHYLEGTSIEYQNINLSNIHIEGMEIITYFLSTCSNVIEVINLSKYITVTNIIHQNQILPATMHYTFLDTSGDSVILEADTNGQFKIHHKTVGVFTNSPSYTEHINNLSWYIASSLELNALNKKNINKFILDNIEIKGDKNKKPYQRNDILPGSYTSTDRFIKLCTLKHLINCGKDYNDEEILLKGNEIISNVYVPKHQGYFYYNYILKDNKENATYKDHDINGKNIYGGGDNYTQYVVMYDLTNKSLYIKTDKSLIYDKINLKNQTSDIIIYSVNNNPKLGIINHN